MIRVVLDAEGDQGGADGKPPRHKATTTGSGRVNRSTSQERTMSPAAIGAFKYS